MERWELFSLAVGLGLLSFIEPCTIGGHLLFIRYLEGHNRRWQLVQTILFTLTRALFIGLLGVGIAYIGNAFFDLQHIFWIMLGVGYGAVGVLYLTGKQGSLMHSFGLHPQHNHGAIALGLLFGLNIPACAAPLLGTVLGASFGATTLSDGFFTLALFGGAISFPLLLVVIWEPSRRWLDQLTRFSSDIPTWIGWALIALGVWSISLGIRGIE